MARLPLQSRGWINIRLRWTSDAFRGRSDVLGQNCSPVDPQIPYDNGDATRFNPTLIAIVPTLSSVV